MTTEWRGVVKFEPNDHDLFRLVQKRVAAKWSWEQIAAEIGCEVKPLLEWVNYGYKARQLPAAISSPAITYQGRPITSHRSMADEARKFEIWRKAQAGAAKTRAMQQ